MSQDSLDHCPIPVNTDQNCGIDPDANQYRSSLTNADQFLSISINARSRGCFTDALIQHWSALRGIDRQWLIVSGISYQGFDPHWSALIGIGHWSRESWWVIDMQNITHRIQPIVNIVIISSGAVFDMVMLKK